MFQNTKLLFFVSIILIVVGFPLLWLGLNPQDNVLAPTPTVTQVPEPSKAVNFEEKGRVLVTKVIDGDTIKVGDITIRLLGIDTPETVDPRKPVQCFGKEASNKLKNLLEGKEIISEKDVSEKDYYKRLLRYIYLPLEDETLLFVNDYMIREGFAKVLTIPPDVEFAEQFLEAQRQAREEKRGLWGAC